MLIQSYASLLETPKFAVCIIKPTKSREYSRKQPLPEAVASGAKAVTRSLTDGSLFEK